MLLKVSARSNPNSVAGAIAGIIREQGTVAVQIIGAGALNQAIKAVCIARAFLEPDGIDPVCIPTFQDVEIGGENRTAIRLVVEHRAGADVSPRGATAPARDVPAGEEPAVPAGSNGGDEIQ